MHGGCSTGAKSGKLRYSDFVPTAIVSKYEEFCVEDKADIISLDSEIALLRARITDLEGRNEQGQFNKDLLQFIEVLRRLVETKQDIESENKTKLEVNVVMKIVDLFISIVDRTVKDIEIKKTIAGEMRRLNEIDLGLRLFN